MNEGDRDGMTLAPGSLPTLLARGVLLVLVVGCQSRADPHAARPTPAEAIPLTQLALTSTAFGDQQSIPKQYTCEGGDTSPPLAWSGVPAGTKSLALIVDDPDAPDPAAPQRVWVHWVVFDIPAEATSFAEGAATSGLPAGAKVGKNDWGKAAYGGPCPPSGRHRYFHKVYALDTTLELKQPTKAELERAMHGHILGKAELVGTYQKGQ